MERPWQYFWFTLAAMIGCALLASSFSRGVAPLNLGSVADWFSGCAAVAAAGTALHIANREARRANDLRIEQDRTAAQARRASDTRLLVATLSIMDNGAYAVRHIYDEIKRGGDPEQWAASFTTSGNSSSTSDALAEIPIEAFEDTSSSISVITARRMWALEVAKLVAMSRGEPPDKDDMDGAALQEFNETLASLIVLRGVATTDFETPQVRRLISAAIEKRAAKLEEHHAAA